VGEDMTLYEVSTNFYKTNLYRNLKIPRQDLEPQKPGFCDFPLEYGERYFKMLTAEEKRSDGSFHCPQGRRNEALDVRVLNLCAADIFLANEVNFLRSQMQAQGVKKEILAGITQREIIQILESETK
jgi:phage terminase large subunit GpA-like protein